MRGVAGALIRRQHAGVVQRLRKVSAIRGGIVEQNQRIAGDAALVRFDFIGMIALRATVRWLREISACALSR